MPRASAGSMSVLVLRALVMGAQQRGIEPKSLAERAGIPAELVSPEILGDPNGRVLAGHIVKLWEFLPVALADECFGLSLASLAAGAPLSVGWWVVWSSPTLGAGLSQAIRYQRLLHDQARSELIYREREREGVYRHQIGAVPDRAPRHAIEFGFATFARHAQRATGKPILPARVRFQHAPPRDLTQHRAVFGPQLEFQRDTDELVYDLATLELPLLTADASLQEVVESHARGLLAAFPDQHGLDARLRAAICEEMRQGSLSLDSVARRLGTPSRTLQRRLKSEGTSFAAMVDLLRRDLAERYLRDRRLTVQEVAFLLGFSDVSAFHRAFVRWTGTTPRRFQETNAAR
ncbi:MAG TPA: AraC family transcriptional regulator ligand-binding domain-containing protein [Polyangiaceae bacterium]|nr:AraC family transcriptional regulator ligand-binding domain-containing protein [Polyangiaceae bacterium]